MGIANFFFGKVFKSLLSKNIAKYCLSNHASGVFISKLWVERKSSLVKNQQIFLRSLTAKLMKIF
jgi:hypothetical protein